MTTGKKKIYREKKSSFKPNCRLVSCNANTPDKLEASKHVSVSMSVTSTLSLSLSISLSVSLFTLGINAHNMSYAYNLT